MGEVLARCQLQLLYVTTEHVDNALDGRQWRRHVNDDDSIHSKNPEYTTHDFLGVKYDAISRHSSRDRAG